MGIPESASIPYESQDLRGERLLVLAPHPDDEVIGCGGLVALHVRERRPVHVVVVTDGAEAGDAQRRQVESRNGLAVLGDVSLRFLGFPDRKLDQKTGDLTPQLRAILEEVKPDLIAIPSPAEIHPDHVALSRAFCELIQHDAKLFADLATARVAFYEVSAPIRPNTLLDITSVASLKFDAIAAHASQREFRDYRSYAEGLNAYRSMSLPADAKFAEGYWVTPLPAIRTIPFSELRNAVAAPKAIEIPGEALPISVIVRTKNRPALLAEAIGSIRRGGYPADVVVVNDGGEAPTVDRATIINHPKPRGRSEAMNAGVRAAKSAFVAFLDDDDLFYAEHLPTLANAAQSSPQHAAWYSDAVSTFSRMNPSGDYETHSRMRIFGQDFDRELLLIDNFIPLPTLLVPRESFLDIGGFDADFDLFEDWDFLIRLSQRGTFVHVPRITCEIRHVEGAGSITMESPEGSARFREAKLQVWKKHAALIDNNVIANVFERQKQRLGTVHNELVVASGERSHMYNDIARLTRDKGDLIDEIQRQDASRTEMGLQIARLDGANAEIRKAMESIEADRDEKIARLTEFQRAVTDLAAALQESQRTNGALYNEVARLQNLLDMIYKSRTWKLHSMVEKMKGRG